MDNEQDIVFDFSGRRLTVTLPCTAADMPPHVLKLFQLGMLLMARVAEKEETYGSSWKRRGGPGAFMVTARKWDRIEETAKRNGWDILAAMAANDASVLDDIGDLIGYLLLWLGENEVRQSVLDSYGPMQETLMRMAQETRKRRLELTPEELRKSQAARPTHIPATEPPLPPHITRHVLEQAPADTLHHVTPRNLRTERADSSQGMPFSPVQPPYPES